MSASVHLGHVERQAGPAAAAVDHDPQLAVGHEVDVAVEVAQAGAAHRDALHGRGLAVHLDDVADRELVLGQDEDAGNDVPHHGLGAEAEGDPGDARAGEQRPHVPPEDDEHVDQSAEGDDGGGQAAEDLAQRVGAGLHLGAALAGAQQPALHARHQQVDQPLEQEGESERDDHAHAATQQLLASGKQPGQPGSGRERRHRAAPLTARRGRGVRVTRGSHGPRLRPDPRPSCGPDA